MVEHRTLTDSMKHPAVVAVIAAMLGILANTVVASLGQRHALQIEERRDRREIVLELLRQGDAERTVQKLRLLNDSGLLPDKDGRLALAVTESRIGAPCEVRLIGPPPRIKSQLTGQAQRDARVLAGQAVRLQQYAEGLRDVLETCGAKFETEE